MITLAATENYSSQQTKSLDAMALLRADHKLVSDLFEQYEATQALAKKKIIVAKICTELTVHAQIEEEIFYPAVKKALPDKTLILQAAVEHATLKDLIAQVQGIEPIGKMFDAKIKVLSQYVKHYVNEEQNQMFPKVKTADLDLIKLGTQIGERKAQLMAARI